MTQNDLQVEENSAEPPKWFRILANRYTLILSCLFLLAILPIACRSYVLSKIPYIDHPFDLEEFGTVEISDEDNAYIEYEKASSFLYDQNLKSFSEDDELKLEQIMDGGDWTLVTPTIKQWMKKNERALEIWKIGTRKPSYLFIHSKNLSMMTILEAGDELRTFARLAILQGKKFEADEEVGKAMENYLCTFRSSRHTGQHGSIIERLIGIAIHTWAVDSFCKWSQLKKVDAKQLELARSKIEKAFQMTESLSANIKCEYIASEYMLRVRGNDYYEYCSRENRWEDCFHYFKSAEPDFSLLVYRHLCENWLNQVDRPHHQRAMFFKHKHNQYSDLVFDLKSSSTRISSKQLIDILDKSVSAKKLLASIDRFVFWNDREKTRQGVLVMVLAAEQYKRENGSYPPDSQSLINKGYLDELPLDHLQSKKCHLQYRNTEKGSVVYSIGRDGLDNGGFSAGLSSDCPDYGYIIESSENQSTSQSDTQP